MKKNRKKDKTIRSAVLLPVQQLLNSRIPAMALIIILAVWVFVVLSNYFRSNPFNISAFETYFSLAQYPAVFGAVNIVHILGYSTTILFTGLIFLAAYAAGKDIYGLFHIDDATGLERCLFSTSIGTGIIILVVFFLGVAGFLYRLPVVLLILALALYGLYGIARMLRQEGKQSGVLKQLSGIEKLWLLIAAFFGVIILVGALSPETFYDSLVYHLGKPNFWIENHRIMPDEAKQVTGFFPGNVNIVYSVGLLFKDETVCKVSAFCFGILACLAVYAMGRRFSGHAAGFLGAFIYATIPSVGLVSYRSAMEMPLAFFETLAVFAMVLWLLRQERKWILLSGICCGLAAGSKYTGFYCGISITMVLVIDSLVSRRSLFDAVKTSTLFIGVAALVSLPWWIYNFYFTGNPVYPFFWKYVGHIQPRPLEDAATRVVNIGHWSKFFMSLVKGPWTVSMGKHEEAFLGPMLLMFFPLFFFLKIAWKPARMLFVYAAVYWAIWGNFHEMYVRYFIPALTVMSFLSAFYLSEAPISAIVKKLFYAVITVVAIANIALVMALQKASNNALGVVLGLESKQEYLNRSRMTYPAPYFSLAEWINRNTPKDSYIVSMGELRSFNIHRRVMMIDVSNDVPLIQWAETAGDENELYNKVRQKGVTHVLLNVPEAQRLTTVDITHFNEKGLATFTRFWKKYVREEYRSISDNEIIQRGIFSMKAQLPDWWTQYSANPFNYSYLYRIMDKDEASRPHSAPFNFFLAEQLYSPTRWKKLQPLAETLRQQ